MPASTEILNDGRYRIEQQIPINGQTAVYEAYDTVNDSNVIVKEIVIPMGKVVPAAQQGQLQNTFAEQARKLTEVRHDSLHHVSDYFSDVGRQYLVLESLDGDVLGDALESAGVGFDLADVLRWADELLDALNYLHNLVPPIVHQNIRPRHIRLTSDNRIKLLAFGSADANGIGVNTNLSGQLLEAEISYSALEQIWGDLDPASQKVISNSFDEANSRALTEPLTPGADIYSLGATLYHLLTGRKPVDALERAIEILEGKPDPLKPISELVPDIPPEICDVIRRAMEIKLSDRYDSAAIMRQVLKTAQIRAKEREEEEEREMAEAAEVLRAAELLKQAEVKQLLEKKQQEIEEEQRRQAALLEQKLREAEEQRIAAEQRAAEMERLLREQAANSAPQPAEEDLLLDIEPLHASNPPQDILTSGAAEEVILSELVDVLLPETPETREHALHASIEPNPPVEAARIEDRAVENVEPVTDAVYQVDIETSFAEEHDSEDGVIEKEERYEAETPVELSPNEEEMSEILPAGVSITGSEAGSNAYESLEEDYAYEVPRSPVLSMPMIAGAVGLVLCFVVIAGWFVMGSSDQTSQTPPSPAAVMTSEDAEIRHEATNEPAQVESGDPAKVAGQETSDEVESVVVSSTDQTAPQRTPTVRPTPQRTPQARDEAPKPTPERRRAVTVDDLINDN